MGDHSTIVCEAEGENILLTDSAKAKLRGLKMYGKPTQDGTPSPENPVDIVGAGQDGDVCVKVCGTNLIETIAGKKAGETITASYGDVNANNYTDAILYELPCYGVERFLSWTATHTSGYTLYLRFFDKDKNYISNVKPGFASGGNVDVKRTTVVPSEAKYYAIVARQEYTCVCSEFMLNLGSIALPYEPYNGNTLTVLTPNGLNEGDYIDFEEGVRMESGIKTPLTEEELAQFAALQTNYPTTTILNDAGVGMEVSYVADTKNYIDKKFNELAAAIVAKA